MVQKETRITSGTGRLSGNGECGFLQVKLGTQQVTFDHSWKKKRIAKAIYNECINFEDLFPPICDVLQNNPEKLFKFKVTIEVEAEKPHSDYCTG